VIAVPPGVRILLAARPVDFRKGMDGLAALVQQTLRADPFAGEVFVFRPKRADRVKILVYDGTGLVLYSKRLEAGRFCWPPPAEGVVRLSAAQLATLLEGLPWHRLQPRAIPRPRRPGERRCWPSCLAASKTAPCRWRWMIFHETQSGCYSSCSI
jgi:transposase